eukprot:scaffold109140_cov63-Phaeocystis_antarctica.AAC.2
MSGLGVRPASASATRLTASSGTPACAHTALAYSQSSSHGQAPLAASACSSSSQMRSSLSATELSTPPLSSTATSSSAAAHVKPLGASQGATLGPAPATTPAAAPAAAPTASPLPLGAPLAAAPSWPSSASAAAADCSCARIVSSMLATPLSRLGESTLVSPAASLTSSALSARNDSSVSPRRPRTSSATRPRARRESAMPLSSSVPFAEMLASTWTTDVHPGTRVSARSICSESAGGSVSPSRMSRSVRSRGLLGARSADDRRRKRRGSGGGSAATMDTAGKAAGWWIHAAGADGVQRVMRPRMA